ncbi:MAG: TrkA C-terminal domain-containing protein [Victivallales bacterium]|nr:TrkA C-terminal domain-containing protein [Victivallales bacterium]
MVAVTSLLIIVALSLVVTRIATMALVLTGLSHEAARFQARSALTGCGFTTRESEEVVNHPVRRRVVMLLMLVGNAGIVTAVSSLILAFARQQTGTQIWARVASLVLGLALLCLAARSRWVERLLTRGIRWGLRRWTSVEARDYASLLRLANRFAVSEMLVRTGDWVADRSLVEVGLHAEGITILGIQRRDGSYIGVPAGTTRILVVDVLLMYGHGEAVRVLDQRPQGDQGDAAHRLAVEAENRRLRQEEDPAAVQEET